MDLRMEENVLRWLEEELGQNDLVESEQDEDLREEENIIHSPHDTDTEQEDQTDENDTNAEENNSDLDDIMPLAELATYKSQNNTEWRKRLFPTTRARSHNIIQRPLKAKGLDSNASTPLQCFEFFFALMSWNPW